MCEVARCNFEQLYPDLVKTITDADLLALDMEFSGIDLLPTSLFDDAEERYRKSRVSVQQTTPLQVGLATFTKVSSNSDGDSNMHHNTYIVRAFNFLLLPPSFPLLRQQFSCQSSALEFLRLHNLDINACVDKGISFLNSKGLENARTKILDLIRMGDLIGGEQEDAIRERSAKIAEWLKDGSETLKLDPMQSIHPLLLHVELRDRFQGIWTSNDDEGKIVVRRVSEKTRQSLEESEKEMADGSLKKALLLELAGFTRIVRTIINMKKPLVGHNIFTDILHLYDKFVRPLPADFATFKDDFHRLLPNIFDTRAILQEGKAKHSDLKVLLSNARNLDEIFTLLKNDFSHKLNITLPPHFKLSEESSRYDGVSMPHEAGYDAMMAGCVLLHLGHRMAFPPNQERELLRPGQINFEVYRQALLPFINQVNVIRASIDMIRLDPGPEPRSSKPPCLLVHRRDNNSAAFSLKQLHSLVATFGMAEIRPFNSDAALVRFSGYSGYRLLRRELMEDGDLVAEVYRPFRHSAALRRSILAAALMSTAFSIYATSSLFVESWILSVVNIVRPM